jgi:glycosyltransferase involved in cell wall biosynthesis
MQTIFIEMERLRNIHSGLGQFCLNLGNGLSRLLREEAKLHFYVPKPLKNTFGNQHQYHAVSALHKIFPVSFEKFDLWHCTHQESNYLPSHQQTKLILTIHDLNFLEKYKSNFKKKLRLKRIQGKINRASALVFSSKYTEGMVRKYLSVPNIPVKIIYLGQDIKEFPLALPLCLPFLPDGKFIFSIGIVNPKKNFLVLLNLLKYQKEFSLVIAGDNTHAYAKTILDTAKKMNLSARVFLPGTVDEPTKCWLYKNCAAFAFPSLSEGFGLPVVEAMRFGKPVFCSDKTSLPEIGGHEAFYWQNFEPDDMNDVFEKGMHAYSKDKEKTERIKKWASQFSWENTAKAYWTLYAELLMKADRAATVKT